MSLPNLIQTDLLISQPGTTEANIVTVIASPCKGCGGGLGKLGSGKGPHAASLHCAGCGRFHQWLSKTRLAQIN